MNASLESFERYAKGQPDTPAIRFERAQFHSAHARLYALGGQHAKADVEFVASIEQVQGLAEQHPHRRDPRFLDEEARSWNELGRLRWATSLQRSLEAFQRATAIHQQQSREHPNVSRHAFAYAESLGNEAICYKRLGKTDDAQRCYIGSFDVLKRLVREYPDDMGYRSALAKGQSNYGVMLKELGRLAEAEAAHRESLVLREALANQVPTNVEYLDDVANSLLNLASLLTDVRQATARPAEARACFEKAIAIREPLWKRVPSQLDLGISLARSYFGLGVFELRSMRPAESLPWLDKSITLLTELRQRSPDHPDILKLLPGAEQAREEARVARPRVSP